MLKLPASLFLPDLNPLSLFVFILIIVVSELLLGHEFPLQVASLLPQLEEGLLQLEGHLPEVLYTTQLT